MHTRHRRRWLYRYVEFKALLGGLLMKDKFSDCIRIGKVSSINPDRCTAQVTFEDRDDIVSGDLFITVPFTLKDKAYYMPSVGERVRVLFDPDAPSKGCILGSYYADTRTPPIADENKAYINFEDGTLIEYDKKQHTLTINVPESGETSINIVTASKINIDSSGDININSSGNIKVDAANNISMTAPMISLNG